MLIFFSIFIEKYKYFPVQKNIFYYVSAFTCPTLSKEIEFFLVNFGVSIVVTDIRDRKKKNFGLVFLVIGIKVRKIIIFW